MEATATKQQPLNQLLQQDLQLYKESTPTKPTNLSNTCNQTQVKK